MDVIATGLSGLVGSRIAELLGSEYAFSEISFESGLDITDEQAVTEFILSNASASWVFHFAAYTDVQGAEKERALGEGSRAWKVNVAATQYIADACRQSGKKLLYFDTDYAFDGYRESYTEEDTTNPLGWYGQTKAEGAKRVLDMGQQALVLRIANPYRAHPRGKTDFVHKILDRLTQGQIVKAPIDQVFVPTFVDDIARAISVLTGQNAWGMYHVVGNSALSPYEAAREIAGVYACDVSLVQETLFDVYFHDRAPVPQYAALSNRKLQMAGVVMRGFREGLEEMHRQESL